MAIDGVSCVGKTTAITTWDGKTIINGNWKIEGKFLDYNEMQNIHKEFINKKEQQDPFIELCYSAMHVMRTLTSPEKNALDNPDSCYHRLVLADRSCIANLVYYLLFELDGEKNYDKLADIFSQYDEQKKAWPAQSRAPLPHGNDIELRSTSRALFADKQKADLPKETYNLIARIEKCIELIGKELLRINYHVIVVIPTNPFDLVERTIKRGNFDASFVSLDYIRSQTLLFKRFARLLPKETVSIMKIDKHFILDEYQLINHVRLNRGFY